MPRARQYGFLRLDPQGDDYSDLYVPVEILQWFENDDEVEIRTSDDEVVTVDAEFVQHALADHFQGCEDLLTLRDFSEPALLHTLRVRFSRHESYTAVGTILVSVNPYSYHNYEQTYGESIMDMYRRASSKQIMASTSLPPHLFAVAERAMRHAYQQVDDQQAEKPKDQAVIISGESGSGKTEATKLIVQYLSWRSKAVHEDQEKRKEPSADGFISSMPSSASKNKPNVIPIEERIVSTTPLLEALGNARTLRNDNSSRFGKFMRLFMADDGTLLACKIDQYLLEVTRVVKQEAGENNFHILFQLIASIAKDSDKGHHSARPSPPKSSPSKNPDKAGGAFANVFDASLLEMLDLGNHSRFHFLSRGGGHTEVPGLTDKEGWNVTLGCLEALNLEPQELTTMMRLLSAVLHLGNVEVNNPDTDWSLTKEQQKELEQQAEDDARLNKLTWKRLAKMAVMDARKKAGVKKKEWGLAIAKAKLRNNFQSLIRAALNDKAIHQAAQLMHIDPDVLQSVIRFRRIVLSSKGDDTEITAVRSPADAMAVRDALSKAIYSRIWTSVIRSLNNYLDCSKHIIKGEDSLDDRHFIGLLDFAGFEHFFEHANGFEQLLINYANEMLQWHFNCFIFQVEILEYHAEGIDTTEISFRDNEPCVHYIDNPYTGVISLLDDSCRQGDTGELNNDLHREKRFIRHLYDAFGNPKSDLGDMNESKPFYFRPRIDNEYCFGIKHYAGDVIYDTRDVWADKNNDALSNDAKVLIEEGPGNPYIRRVLTDGIDADSLPPPPSPAASGGRKRSQAQRRQSAIFQRSVGRRFSDSLKKLIAALTACYPQFVRCIKPNHEKSPDIFAGFMTFLQLMNSGMIEAINARQAGFAVRIPHASFLYKFACLVKSARWGWHKGLTSGAATSPIVSANTPVGDYGKLLTSQLAMMEEDEKAEAELKRRSDDFVAELGRSMSEVINHHSTRVGKTKVFMKATFAYTLHRIAEITEDHWVRRLQRVVRKWLKMGAHQRESARQRYRALLEAANAALAASRHTRPRRRANLAAETSIAGFKRRLDNLSLGPAAHIYSSKLEAILLEVNSKMDSMMDQCKRIKKAELGIEKAESERIKKDIERLKSSTGTFRPTEPTFDMQGLPTREELDSPQLLYKFTRHMERQIGEAESLSRALGDALEERRIYQAKVWEIYEKFAVNESNPELREGLRPIVEQVLADADGALGTKFDVIEMEGLDGDRMLDRRMAILIAHKEISNYEREMLTKRRALKQATQEQAEQKSRIDALDKEYRVVLDQVELFMELCQSEGATQVSSNGLMSHMERVHRAVEAAEAALEQVMVNAEKKDPRAEVDIYGRSRGSAVNEQLDSLCKARIVDAASVVYQEMKAVQKIVKADGDRRVLHRTSSEGASHSSEKDKKKRSPKSERRPDSSTPKSERRKSDKKEKRKSSGSSHQTSPMINSVMDDNEDGIVVMASLDISHLSLEAQAKVASPSTQTTLSRSAKSTSKSPKSSSSSQFSRSEAKASRSEKHRESRDKSGAAEDLTPPRSKDRSEKDRAERAEKKKERTEKSDKQRIKAEGQFDGRGSNVLLEETLKMSSRNTKKATPVFKTPFEYGNPTSPKVQEAVKDKKPPPLSATRGPSVRDMASNWQRPVVTVNTGTAALASDGLSPVSSFEGRLAEQEERRKRLDELQAARDKEEDSDNEERELEEQKLQAVIAEVMAKEQMLAKHGTSRRTSLEDLEPMSPLSPSPMKSPVIKSPAEKTVRSFFNTSSPSSIKSPKTPLSPEAEDELNQRPETPELSPPDSEESDAEE